MPWTFLKWPRTWVTIMCRTRNSAAVCPGSNPHRAMPTHLRTPLNTQAPTLALFQPLPDEPESPLFALVQHRWRGESQLGPFKQDLPALVAPDPVGKQACGQV